MILQTQNTLSNPLYSLEDIISGDFGSIQIPTYTGFGLNDPALDLSNDPALNSQSDMQKAGDWLGDPINLIIAFLVIVGGVLAVKNL